MGSSNPPRARAECEGAECEWAESEWKDIRRLMGLMELSRCSFSPRGHAAQAALNKA
ncbi:MAG: hypothetical protein Kow00114_29120 [Kiloniellaceae bacterium]